MPRKLANVQSRIKGHVQYYKDMAKERENKSLFNKEPKVYYKDHPSDMGYDHEPRMHDNTAKTKSAVLRNRSPNGHRHYTNKHQQLPIGRDTIP